MLKYDIKSDKTAARSGCGFLRAKKQAYAKANACVIL